MVMYLTIRPCENTDIQSLYDLVTSGNHATDDQYFETAFQEQIDGKRIIYLAFINEQIVGYTHLNFNPQYSMFARLGVPEIQDIFVHPDNRRQGVGEHLIRACEAETLKRSLDTIGIGVGVAGNFGEAQRLYFRMGYMPDGNGAVFERQPIQSGDIRPIDDRLCLMLVKSL